MKAKKFKAIYGRIESGMGVNEAFVTSEIQVYLYADMPIMNEEQTICFFIDNLVTNLTGKKPDFILVEITHQFYNKLLTVDFVVEDMTSLL